MFSSDQVILVQGVGKQFSRHHAERPFTFRDAVLSGWQRMAPIERFWALRNISFSVCAGEMLGIIGRNGAGKSTLLQLIGGIGRPDEGRVSVKGRIGALLDLGAGFHPDLTGRENVIVSAVVAGLTQRQIKRQFDAIVDFAELADFIDNPVRTYSTGMQMRLAFAVAVHTHPEVLLVDEFLSVGDLAFQAKCLEHIAQLKAQGSAIVLISHNVEQVKRLCDLALWLQRGEVVIWGEPEVVTEQYVSELHTQTQQRTGFCPPKLTSHGTELQPQRNRFGSFEIEITDVQLRPTTELKNGEPLTITIHYWTSQLITAPIVSVTISREDGQIYFDTNSSVAELCLPPAQGHQQLTLHLERLDLPGGQYFVDVGIYKHDWAYAYDYHWHVYPFCVLSHTPSQGLILPPHSWKMPSFQMSSLGPYR